MICLLLPARDGSDGIFAARAREERFPRALLIRTYPDFSAPIPSLLPRYVGVDFPLVGFPARYQNSLKNVICSLLCFKKSLLLPRKFQSQNVVDNVPQEAIKTTIFAPPVTSSLHPVWSRSHIASGIPELALSAGKKNQTYISLHLKVTGITNHKRKQNKQINKKHVTGS